VELDNDTGLNATLLRQSIDDDRMLAAVVCRVSFEWNDDAPGRRAEDQSRWPLKPEPEPTPWGVLEPEPTFHRDGVDLFVFGDAIAPAERPTVAMQVRIEAPDFERSALVLGERRWVKHLGVLQPSEPTPFTRLPLTREHAFGGKPQWDGLEVPHPDNPDGVGYYLEEHAAVDGPLPRIEDPAALVRHWNDRPTPVGFGLCPLGCGQRLRAGMELDAEGLQVRRYTRRLFNHAFPEMVLPRLQPGDKLRIEGVHPERPRRVHVPELRLQVTLGFDDERFTRPMRIEQLGIEMQQGRLFVTYRFPFRYVIHPRQLRSCRLHLAE
jgi:hypothetical protein